MGDGRWSHLTPALSPSGEGGVGTARSQRSEVFGYFGFLLSTFSIFPRAVEPAAPEEGGGKEGDKPAVGVLLAGFPLGAEQADQVEPEDAERGEGKEAPPEVRGQRSEGSGGTTDHGTTDYGTFR